MSVARIRRYSLNAMFSSLKMQGHYRIENTIDRRALSESTPGDG